MSSARILPCSMAIKFMLVDYTAVVVMVIYFCYNCSLVCNVYPCMKIYSTSKWISFYNVIWSKLCALCAYHRTFSLFSQEQLPIWLIAAVVISLHVLNQMYIITRHYTRKYVKDLSGRREKRISISKIEIFYASH